MSPHFFAHIIYILESIENIEAFIADSAQGLGDRKTYDAVLYRIQTLSESACKLPIDIKESYPFVPWNRFNRTRNVIVHDYLGDIFQEEVLDFIEKELRLLEDAMKHQLPEWKELLSRLQDDLS